MLSVRRGAQAVDFYKAAFGAAEFFRIESPDGAVVAQLAVGTSDFWVADESPEYKNFSPESLGGATTRMVLTVDDPDGVFANGRRGRSLRGLAGRRSGLWMARGTCRRSLRPPLGNRQTALETSIGAHETAKSSTPRVSGCAGR